MKKLLFLLGILILGLDGFAQVPFTSLDTNFGTRTLILPTGYQYTPLFIGGVDSVRLANGAMQSSRESHDLCVYIPKNNSSTEGTIYVGHETSGIDAVRGNGGGATVFDVKKGPYQWEVVGARKKVDFTSVGGTRNNCAGNISPKGTVFTAEEVYPTNNPGLGWGSDTADYGGYKKYLNFGWMVEVDPINNQVIQKCYAMGRYAKESIVFMTDRKTAYLTNDATPAVFFKFVADNVDDYSTGQLYAYKQSVDGLSGSWLTIPRHRDSLNIAYNVALRMGATMFVRHEDIEVTPDGSILIAETGADVFDVTSWELQGNRMALYHEARRIPGTGRFVDTFGRVAKFNTTTLQMKPYLEGGRGLNGKNFSSVDNIAVDRVRNIAILMEDLTGTSAGRSPRNTVCEAYALDLSIPNPTVNDLKLFMIVPLSGESTGGFFTPDGQTFFVNIQHPATSDFYPFQRAVTLAIHATGIRSKTYDLKSSAFIGNADGVNIYMGGLSGLDAIPGVPNGYMSVSDRGPNADADNINGGNAAIVFPFPGFNPVMYELRTEADSIRIVNTIPLKSPSGGNVSGLSVPLPNDVTGDPPQWTNTSKVLTGTDVWGIDAEGIVPGMENDYLICDEYGPSVWSVDKITGKLKTRFTPFPIAGQEVLFDSIYKKRRANRGFEGVAFTPRGRLVTILQSPEYNPNGTEGDKSQIHRLLEIDMTSGKARTFAYLHQPKTGNLREKDWKMGDIVAINDYEFLVIEHAVRNLEDSKKIYKIDIRNATPITTDNFAGKTLEQLVDLNGLTSFNIKPVEKVFIMDLLANGYDPFYDKPEGLALVNDSTLSVAIDNDFGITSTNVDGVISGTGKKSRIYEYTLTPEQRIKNIVRITDRINARLSISPSVLKFDSVATNQTTLRSVTLTNSGTHTVKISNQYFTSNDGDFTFTPLTGANLTVKPGETRTVNITFKPLQHGTRTARLGFKTDIPETYSTPRVDTSLIALDIWANGVPSARLIGDISEPDTVLVGKEHCRMDTIYNDGDAAITITGINLGGVYPEEFKVSGYTTPFVLNAKQKMIISICSRPSAPGLRPAALELYGRSADKNVSYYLSITSFGSKVAIIAQRDSIFTDKQVPVGSSETENVRITNVGNIATTYEATFLSKKPVGYSFGTSVTTGNLDPEQEITIPVTFTPTSIGSTNETILITATNTLPVSVSLSAVGTGVKLSSTASFAQAELGKTGVEYQLPIKNEGNIEWVSGTPLLDGTFSYVKGLTTPIGSGETRDITLLYWPNSSSDTVGSITFPNSSPLLLGENTIILHGKVLATSDVNVADKAGFAITRIYPNPTGTEANIEYTLPGSSDVTMELCSVSGEIIKQITEKGLLAGSHQMFLNVSSFPSGSYIVSLKTAFGLTKTNLNIVK
ncbi:MAG TPA: esterase-like activity of phytase family protein [Candidatus Kapabacteria bacterium]